jgi:hypothetical protein
MSVIECDVPACSALDRAMVGESDFHDSWRVPLVHPERGMADIFFAVFGHTPLWMKTMLLVRNALARLAGLEVPKAAEIMTPEIRSAYRVGDKIGPWPVFFVGDNEIIAGRDNKHMDFRLSVLKVRGDSAADLVVSTICSTHNLFGRIYLFAIIPFHRAGVQGLLARAVRAGRL